ncbi:MAG: hypothetical protein M1838_005226 [Thelocarpon superellum]|nr:MAG: hypothetical protein M1838_005226 [Thelocarpon superellum]
MEASAAQEELAQLQKLSNEYQPDVEGPLVGPLRSSDALTSEYAQADPVFVQKTAALPNKYSHYRTVKGDGNCAIAFSYFETLQRVGDRQRILEEETRLRSLNNLLNLAGFQHYLYEDFVDETISLLRLIASSPPSATGDTLLFDKFNDPAVSNAIITHFRLITSAWMKTRPASYQPFILDGTVEQYCAAQIEPYQVEIEHVGMNAMIDALVKPAGFAVEILYLDRSPGLEVNEHRFETCDATGTPIYTAPTMRLLYRPGHYDILYRAEAAPEIPQTQVALVDIGYNEIQDLPTAAIGHGAVPCLASIPGMSYVGMSGGSMIPMGLSMPMPPLSIPPSVSSEQAAVPLSPVSTVPLSPLSIGPRPVLPVPAIPTSPTFRTSPSALENKAGSFRHSKYEYESFFPSPAATKPFQTATFRE